MYPAKVTSTVVHWIESACQWRGHRFDSWSRKVPHAKEQLSLRATTTEPVQNHYWSPHSESQGSTTKEATAMRSLNSSMRSLSSPMISLSSAMKNSARSTQLEKVRANQLRPSTPTQPRINFKNLKKKMYLAKYQIGLLSAHLFFFLISFMM